MPKCLVGVGVLEVASSALMDPSVPNLVVVAVSVVAAGLSMGSGNGEDEEWKPGHFGGLAVV